ncbi:MAG: 50S ribosomal protein L29 [Phycisphaerales bacterium]
MARKPKNITRLSDEELTIEIRDARRKLFDLRSQRVTDKIEDTTQFSRARKTVARLLTEQTRRNAGVSS